MTKEERKIITERFSIIYDDLQAKHFEGKKIRFAEKLGTHSHIINEMLKGERMLTPEHIQNLLKAIPINLNWLLGDDSQPKYLKESNLPSKFKTMEEFRELRAKIKRLEKQCGDKDHYIEELLIKIDSLEMGESSKQMG